FLGSLGEALVCLVVGVYFDMYLFTLSLFSLYLFLVIGGSISMGEHEHRMVATTGVKPTMEEVFAKCHIRKDKSWVDRRAEDTYVNFKKRKTELFEMSLPQNQDGEGLSCESRHNMPDDITIWNEVVPKVYGILEDSRKFVTHVGF
ncbi:hypothetical protein L195_g021446, partial [Trifolium pratense]